MKFNTSSIRNCCTALFIAAVFTGQLLAQDGSQSGFSAQAAFGPQVPFASIWNGTVQGDYVAAGVGMRNIGSGTINISIPAGATIRNAWVFWSVVWSAAPPPNTGMVNGTPIFGNYIGTSGSPCWGGSGMDYFYANIYNIVNNGANTLAGFPSGLTNNAPPLGNAVFPLMEGATIVVVFCHPAWDYNDVAVYAGAQTFATQVTTNPFGSYTGWSGGNPADQTAQTTFIMADGQARWAGDGTLFNGTAYSGPGTAVKTADAFDGADGIAAVFALDGLWDTHTIDVSPEFSNGVLTAANVSALAGAGADCIGWGGQVISVKSALNAFLDVKPGSCPNSVNINSNGMLPVDIVGSVWFDVSNIDASSVLLEGVAATGSALIQDNSTPFMSGCMVLDCYDCNILGPDGLPDLHLKFKMQDVVAALGPVQSGDCIEVTLTGNLNNGTPFSAKDVIRIIDNSTPKSASNASEYGFTLAQNTPNPVSVGTEFSFTLPEEASVTLDIFNVLGQRIARVVNGTRSSGAHTVVWDGLSSSGVPLAPGTYIYRLTAGERSLSKSLVITR